MYLGCRGGIYRGVVTWYAEMEYLEVLVGTWDAEVEYLEVLVGTWDAEVEYLEELVSGMQRWNI